MKFRIVILFLCSWLATSATGQDSMLSNFKAELFNGNVLLSWTIKEGNTCNGTTIYRSTDSLNFVEIGDIQGVCGNLGIPTNYTFVDYQPEQNKKNYYRLDLGGIEISPIVSIEVIDISNQGFYLRPNPIVDQGRLFFSNSLNQEHRIWIYDALGRIRLSITTMENYIDIKANELSNGYFYFLISNTSTLTEVTGSFIIVQ